MGDDWYCLIFGEELGPMSWDDLVNMASHGMLSGNAKVKRGPQADWVQADSVEGLFTTSPPAVLEKASEHAAGLHVGSTWYCEVLGNELGPFTWADLLEMAQRGQLTRTQQVRQEREADWSLAEQIPGLFVGREETGSEVAVPLSTQAVKSELSPDDVDFDVAATVVRSNRDDTEFEVSKIENRPAETTVSPSDDADFELSRPGSVGSSDETSFDVASTPDQSPGGDEQANDADFEIDASPPKTTAPADDDFEMAPAVQSAPTHDDEFDLQPADSTVASLTSVAATKLATDRAAQATPETPAEAKSPAPPSRAAKKKKAEKRPREKAAKSASGVGLSEENKRAVLVTIGIASLAGLAYVAYLGIVALASMRSANYDEILAGYDELFQQAKQAQTDTSISSSPEVATQFLARINELRGPLQNAPPGSVDAQLFEVGTMLVELFASAAAPPRSQVAMERQATEGKYLAKIASLRTELGHHQ